MKDSMQTKQKFCKYLLKIIACIIVISKSYREQFILLAILSQTESKIDIMKITLD